ncbi:hypothetical protein [Streptomyces sp. NPDC058683]|uniref:hypothetical protein n=1 Tax=Streptomyces sp. NPDC058683 TaxID=3346597 RepID=UPI003648C1D1
MDDTFDTFDAFDALDEQPGTVAGTDATALTAPGLDAPQAAEATRLPDPTRPRFP